MDLLSTLAARQRFGIKPGLDTIRAISAALGHPEHNLPTLHIAGTDGKGATCAILDACLRAANFTTGRYTSPHLVNINERFFLNGAPLDDATLNRAAQRLAALEPTCPAFQNLTFFEALTAIAFLVYHDARPDWTILETGLGGRLDATNICEPSLTIITRIGLDHCDWLGHTLEQIATEKAGIIKPNVPIILGANEECVRKKIAAVASERNAPFYYAPDLIPLSEVPTNLSLRGTFNRENAQTALAALQVLLGKDRAKSAAQLGFPNVIWPGRYQKVNSFIIDGAHNPPAARALVQSLKEDNLTKLNLIAGFCGDKAVDEVLQILQPFISHAYAIQTNNPRSLTAEETAAKMTAANIPCVDAMPSLSAALSAAKNSPTLICGSLFLAGEALVVLNAYPYPATRFDPSEQLHPTPSRG